MVEHRPVGPELVIVGAARSGTSFLSATLDHHPSIDAGSMKEPNYFSSKWDQGSDWYDGLFEPRSKGLTRVDGSVSYTYPQHPLALSRVHDSNPDVQVVFTVREPEARLVSHFQLFRHYYNRTDWNTLSEGLAKSEMFLGAGDYGLWLGRLRDTFPLEQILVVPFPATTSGVTETAALLLERLGLPATEADLAAPTFRNEVRQFRSPRLQAIHRQVHRTGLYPAVRRMVGPDRLRKLRGAVTKPTTVPKREDELASLTAAQVEQVAESKARATEAVSTWLAEQDARLGMDYSSVWADHVAPREKA